MASWASDRGGVLVGGSAAYALILDGLSGVERVGITAGASTPECLVREVCDRLLAWGATSVRTLPGPHETAHFRSPAMPPVEAVTPDAALA